MYKENPDSKFVDMYLNLITTNCVDRLEKFKMVKELYNYTIRNINLGDEYRIMIKSRNIKIQEPIQKIKVKSL